MILPKIDADGFLDTVRHAPAIAFQKVAHGYAVAASSVAFYAPIDHPGGGNLDDELFANKLGLAFLSRVSLRPTAKTLRPTAKPTPGLAILRYMESVAAGHEIDFEAGFAKLTGDHPSVIDYQTQVVIRAIEEHNRPDLRHAMELPKRELMAEVIDSVIEHAEAARELCEGAAYQPFRIKANLLLASTAMKSALVLLLDT